MTIFGPFSKTEATAAQTRYTRAWYRQRPIQHAPLAYDLDVMYALPSTKGTQGRFWESWSFDPWNGSSFGQNTALMKARERFNAKIGENTMLAVDILELGQSLEMIERRAIQLWQFTRAIRKGRFGDAQAVIRDRSLLARPPTGLRRGKGFANNFLEWHFGWSPLIGDIGAAVEILQGPLPANPVKARAHYNFSETIRNEVYLPTPYFWKQWRDWQFKCELGADVYVSNPNLNLARQLGFVNPASVAWEVVPFSFVVDWFVPVGQFLDQWTDFVGLTLQNQRTTISAKVEDFDHLRQGPSPQIVDQFTDKARFHLKRQLGIASFKLMANRVTGLSATRAATAISLLLQQLDGREPRPVPPKKRPWGW